MAKPAQAEHSLLVEFFNYISTLVGHFYHLPDKTRKEIEELLDKRKEKKRR